MTEAELQELQQELARLERAVRMLRQRISQENSRRLRQKLGVTESTFMPARHRRSYREMQRGPDGVYAFPTQRERSTDKEGKRP